MSGKWWKLTLAALAVGGMAWAGSKRDKGPRAALPRNTEPDNLDRVDQAISESFPASDPPSWTGGVSNGLPDV